MSTERTPLPWRIDGEGIRALIRGSDVTIVAVRHRLLRDIHEANFAYIVQACNSFDDLISALSRIIRADDAQSLSQDDIEAARAALAKAGVQV